MKFGDIIRQPLPVATFTFLVVVIVAFVRAWVTQRFAGEIPAVSAPLGYYTAALRLSWPLLSAAASIVMLFVAGFLIGRSSVRAELYATRCFLAMPLFGVVSCGVLLSSDYLTQSLTLLLLALASRNYYNSFHRHYCFDRMFRGSLYVGLIPLLYAPGAGLLLLIPLVVLLSGARCAKRSSRCQARSCRSFSPVSSIGRQAGDSTAPCGRSQRR